MSTRDEKREQLVDQLTEAEKPTGRQDLISPPATAEPSDSTPVDMQRGFRIWVGFTLVGVLFVLIIAYFWLTG